MSSLYPSSGRQALQNLLTSTRHRTLIFANKDKRDLLSEDEPPSYDDAQDWSSGLTRGLETPFLSQIGAPGRITISWSQFSRVETTITSCLLSNSVLVQKILRTSASKSREPTPKSQAEVRNTVLNLVRDLVTSPSSYMGASLWSDGREQR